MAQPNQRVSCALPLKGTETARARPPTEALAIHTIAQRNTSFTLNDIACPLCRHSVGQAGPNRPASRRQHDLGRGGLRVRRADRPRRRFRWVPHALGAAALGRGRALLAVALAGRSLRGSFGCGLAFGFALFVPLLSWLVNEAWYAWAALAGAEAVILAVLAIGQRLLLRLPYWPVAVAGWWVLYEGVRDRWLYAFPWGRLAMSQSVAPDVRWVAVGGVPLLSFLIALAGAMLARAALYSLGGNDPPQNPPSHGGGPPPPLTPPPPP